MSDIQDWKNLPDGKNLGSAWAIKFAIQILDEYMNSDASLEQKVLAQHASMIFSFVGQQGGCGEIPPGSGPLTDVIDTAVFG